MKVLETLLGHLSWMIAWMIPFYALCHLLYYVISLPLRRQERARFFLDLIETSLKQGGSIERTIVSISQSRDGSLGVQFHLLAKYLESGWGLIRALSELPGYLPPQMAAMLRVGEEAGDVRKVLPACRTLLKDGSSQVQSSHSYLIVLAFVIIPITPAVFWMMSTFVIPRLQSIFADFLEGAPVPSFPLFYVASTLARVQLILAALFYLGAVFFVGGPRFTAWLRAGLTVPRLDWLAFAVPWKRKRMQRNFSSMLAVLLEAGVPEERAVQLAGESTANEVFVRRADRVKARLSRGVKLTEALEEIDRAGELRWRVSNAIRSGRNFLAALAGWLESLDAKAFQEEQAAAHVVTTMFVVINGVMVALFAIFLFRGLTTILEEAVLW